MLDLLTNSDLSPATLTRWPIPVNERIKSSADWVNPDVIGVDLGITLLSAENLGTGRVWKWFMMNPEIPLALERAGVMPRR